MYQRPKKLMTMFKRDDIDRLYAKKKGRRGHASIEGRADVIFQGLEEYIYKKSKELLITAVYEMIWTCRARENLE